MGANRSVTTLFHILSASRRQERGDQYAKRLQQQERERELDTMPIRQHPEPKRNDDIDRREQLAERVHEPTPARRRPVRPCLRQRIHRRDEETDQQECHDG